jgi:hypothetical protein
VRAGTHRRAQEQWRPTASFESASVAVLLGRNAMHGLEWIDDQTSTITLMIVVTSPELASLIMS